MHVPADDPLQPLRYCPAGHVVVEHAVHVPADDPLQPLRYSFAGHVVGQATQDAAAARLGAARSSLPRRNHDGDLTGILCER